jgi:hypothetical protein
MATFTATEFRQFTSDSFDQLKHPETILGTTTDWLGSIENITSDKVVDLFFGKSKETIGHLREKFSDYVGRSAKVLSSLAAAQVGALVGGPGGLVAAELLTSVSKDAIESFTEKKVNPNFKYAKGDWVIVDRGHNHALSKKVLLEETVLTGSMWGDFDLDLARDLHKTGEEYSVGFFMSESTVPGESNVFVFEVKDTQSVPNKKLAPMTAAMKKKYDTNFSYAAVREMILEKEQLPSLLENVRVENRLEVGSEVVYESKVQHIVSGDSFHSIIEDMDGKRKLVKNSEVTPGRSTTLGIYNYSANDRREFFEPETLATGMFVWVPADKENNLTIQCERVLCVVGYFFGNTAELFEAFNGRERSVHKDKLEMLSDARGFERKQLIMTQT